MPADSRDMVEEAARDIWRFFKSEPEWFDANKSLGGPQWLINRLRALSASPARGEGDAPVAWWIKRTNAAAGFGRPKVFVTEEASEGDLKQWRRNGYEVHPLVFGDTHPTPATPAGEELREAEGRFVAGPVWREAEITDEDGEPIWTSGVQTIGGYSVIATVHGGSEAEVTARRDAILAALQPQAEGE